MIILSLICLALALYCYSIAELQRQGLLTWSDKPFEFWGQHSDKRKYRDGDKGGKEPAFPLSTTLLVFLTDGYHFMQFWFFNFLALSLTLGIGWNWYLFCSLLIGIRIVHWAARKLLSK